MNEREHGKTLARKLDTNELRAMLQPARLVRVDAPVKTVTGRERFEAGDLVIVQYWGGGQIAVTPVNPRKGPMAWARAHDVGPHVSQLVLGEFAEPSDADLSA